MTSRDDINDAYFEWMYELVCGNRFSKNISYRNVLMDLHNTDFVYSIRRDKGRAGDGVDLRYRFPHEQYGISDVMRYISGPCSVLEMMLALAIRCEETIMDNPAYGDRTGQWFWGMMKSLGLGSMYDDLYDEDYVKMVIRRFLKRQYDPDGKGGLFTIRGCEEDLRDVEIWFQMLWYLDTIT